VIDPDPMPEPLEQHLSLSYKDSACRFCRPAEALLIASPTLVEVGASVAESDLNALISKIR
jgi:hypothetical protein